jgi:hypothetical protein
MKGDPAGQDHRIANKEVCAACDKPIYNNDWVILGSKKIIHMGGAYSDRCYRKINGLGGDSQGRE